MLDHALQDRGLEKIVLPLSGLLSWTAVLSGVLMGLHVLGINIQPLLTVGGVSGVVVGLSAQSVVSNMISGVNLVSQSASCQLLPCYCDRLEDCIQAVQVFPAPDSFSPDLLALGALKWNFVMLVMISPYSLQLCNTMHPKLAGKILE